MQKKLIVLALAGLASSAAFAQTNVTIYGVVDVFGAYHDASNSNGDETRSTLNSGGLSGSRLGFKGEEALGNGLKAIFTYEFGIDPTASASLGITRQAFVGLSGNWGTVVGGRLQTVGYDWGVKYDTFGAAAFSPIGIATNGNDMSISGNNTGLSRQPNTVGYISPNWGGFSIKGHYSFGEELQVDSNNPNTIDSATSIYGIGGYYDNGPLSIGLVYHDIQGASFNGNGGSDPDQQEWGVGASYDFKFLILKASYQAATSDFNTRGVNDYDREAWAVGAGIPIGAMGKVNLAFGQATGDAKADIIGIDYEHSLSKRTTAYIGGTYLDSKKGSAQSSNRFDSLFSPSAVGTSVSPSADESAYMIGAGVRHTF